MKINRKKDVSLKYRCLKSLTCVCSSGPPGLRLEGADQQVATASGLQQGRYTFRLTVSDHQGATDSTSLIVRVQEGQRVRKGSHEN